jgi:signal transduction histidine kinase
MEEWKSCVHPDDLHQDLQLCQISIEKGLSYHNELRLRNHSTNTYKWFLGRAIPIRNDKGDITKWFGSYTDVDDQKRQNEKLEAALKMREDFLSIASHELKTPLTSLKLHTQIFKKRQNQDYNEMINPKQIDALVNQVDKQVNKLNRLVDDMLDISRIQNGKLNLQIQEFDFCELIREVFEFMKRQFSNSSPVPLIASNREHVLVKWDLVRIEQVLINLLTNSIRYGEGKQVSLTITYSDKNVLLNLKDQGIGIDEKNLEKIFHKFEKIKSSSEFSGLGLGLFISKQIIEAHGGRIWAESQIGQGAEFKIDLPL